MITIVVKNIKWLEPIAPDLPTEWAFSDDGRLFEQEDWKCIIASYLYQEFCNGIDDFNVEVV